MKQDITIDINTATWDDIMKAGKAAADAYLDLIRASDALADLLPYSRKYILNRSLIRLTDDRRDQNQILKWLDAERENIDRDLKQWREEHNHEVARKELLKKLSLTAEQKELLGIK